MAVPCGWCVTDICPQTVPLSPIQQLVKHRPGTTHRGPPGGNYQAQTTHRGLPPQTPSQDQGHGISCRGSCPCRWSAGINFRTGINQGLAAATLPHAASGLFIALVIYIHAVTAMGLGGTPKICRQFPTDASCQSPGNWKGGLYPSGR